MSPTESKKVLLRLMNCYPRQELTKDQRAEFERFICDIDIKDAERGIDVWVKSERFFPSIAGFREAALGRRADPSHQRELAKIAADIVP